MPLDMQAVSPPSTVATGATVAAIGNEGTPGVFDPVLARDLHFTPGAARELSKKEEWLRDKVLRPDFHTSDADLMRGAAVSARKSGRRTSTTLAVSMAPGPVHTGERVEPLTTLFNVWTHEALPLIPGEPVEDRFHSFLRDHFTNQPTHMDPRLITVLASVANKFSAKRIEIVSGYRSPKYNLMLRKKGHQVARHSQHMEGNAVDFRVRGVPTKTVLHYVRSLHVGGVGYYPHSQFVHSDTGPIRYWTGS